MTVDNNEQTLYIASYEIPTNVVRLNTTTGAIVDSQSFTGFFGSFSDISINVFPDNSGYYISLGYTDNTPYIFRYIFPYRNCLYQRLNGLAFYIHDTLWLGTDQFFSIARNTQLNANFIKFTFGGLNANWANSMSCPVDQCISIISKSLVSHDNTTIHSLYNFGGTVYYTAFSISDGSVVGTGYKSNRLCSNSYRLILYGEYIITSVFCTNPYLMLFNLSTSLFTFYLFSGSVISDFAEENITKRIILIGSKSSMGYVSKFGLSSIFLIPELTKDSTLEMVPFSSLLITSTTYSYEQTASFQISDPSRAYSNLTVQYNPETPTFYYVYSQTNTEFYSIIEGYSKQVNLNVTCSTTGTTSISYCITDYGGTTAPSWVNIGSASGLLTISATSVSSDSEFYFYVNSVVTGLADPIQKLIKVTVLDCSVTNCFKCSANSGDICINCNSGFELTNNQCISQSDYQTAKDVTITSQSIIGLTAVTVTCLSIMNPSSILSLWSMINQVQLFLLLLLTKAFIPAQIQTVIQGFKFSINLFSSIPLTEVWGFDSIINSFEFELSEQRYSNIGVNSDSTLFNLYSFLVIQASIVVLHIVVLLLRFLMSKINMDLDCLCCIKALKCLTDRIFNFLTLGFYIRAVIEMTQFMMICSIYEVHLWRTESNLRIVSLGFALFVLCAFSCFILTSIYFSCSSYQLEENKHNIFGEFIKNLKPQRKSKFFSSYLSIRKLLFAIALVCMSAAASKILIVALVSIQVCYLAYTIIVRPYSSVKLNLILISNELYFSVLLSALAFLNCEKDWSSMASLSYFWLMISNNFLTFLIVFVDCIIMIAKKCRKPKSNGSQKSLAVAPKERRSRILEEEKKTTNIKNKTEIQESYLRFNIDRESRLSNY